jgi:PAS domain S-box-containing protein
LLLLLLTFLVILVMFIIQQRKKFIFFQHKKYLEEIVSQKTIELKESEERWKFAIDGARDGLWDWNLETNEVFFSMQWKAMLGFEEHEIQGSLDEWSKRVHPEDLQKCYADIQLYLDGKEPFYSNIHRVLCKDGSTKWILARGKVVKFNKNGKPIRMVGTHTDLTERKQAELALKESETKHNSMISNISDVIGIIGIDGIIKYKSPNIEKWFGWKPKDLIGTDGWLTVHPEDLERIRKEFFALLEKEKAVTIVDYRYKCKDNSYKWIELTATNLVNDPIINGVLLNYHDITVRKQAEQLRKSEHDRLTKIANRVPGVVYQYLLRPNGSSCFPFASEAINEIYRVSPEEVREDASKVFAVLHPEDYEAVVSSIQESAKTLTSWKHEYRVKYNDGTIRMLFGNALPQRENDGSILWHGFITDITERKQIEEELIKSESKFKSLFTNISAGVVFCKAIYDKEGNMSDCVYKEMNPLYENFTYLKKEIAIGKKVSDMLPGTEPEWFSTFGKVVKTGKPIDFEMYHQQSEKYYSVFAYNSREDEFSAIFEDITERKKTELIINQQNIELTQLNADKNRFITILSHDLKSPFNSILGFLSLLTKNIRKYDIDKIEKFVNTINNSAQNTFKLLEAILMWVRANSGKIPYEPQKLNFATICNEVFENLKLIANAKDITMNYFSANEIIIFADKNMLNTVLRNLVSNSIKFTDKNGQIDISAETNQTDVIITVSDNGIGIEPDTLNRLFDISEKVTTEGTENEKGTGLGLLLCKEFVEKHSGKIWVESEVGKGSEFKFTIPIMDFQENDE